MDKRKVGKAVAAFIASLLVPGVVHAFCGRLLQAALCWALPLAFCVLAGATGLLHVFWGFVCFEVLSIGLTIGIATHATRIAVLPVSVDRRWAAYLLCVGLAVAQATFGGSDFQIDRVLGVRAYTIPSESMEPTVRLHDRLVADTKHFQRNSPSRGDLVAFWTPEGILMLKRIVALGGDTIEGRAGNVLLVNGRKLTEPYINGTLPSAEDRQVFGPIVVPVERVFVLGDNRDWSLDSRDSQIGLPTIDKLAARPLFLYWSRDRHRIGQALR